MTSKPILWMRKHQKLTALFFFGGLFVLLNIMAFMHAYKMLHFVGKGVKTKAAFALSPLEKVGVIFTGIKVPKPENAETPEAWKMAYETHRFESGKGVELEAWHIPVEHSKAMVIIFHGYAASKATCLSIAKAYNDLGYSTFLVDFRGSGGSSGNTTTIGMAEGEDVAKSLDYVRAHFPNQPVVLHGVSMGAASILKAIASNGAKPDLIVLEAVFDRMLTTTGHRFTAMGAPEFPGARILIFWGSVQIGYWGFAHNPVEYAKEVHCPALVMHGGRDPLARPEEAKNVFENLAGPKEFELFPGISHDTCVRPDASRWKGFVSTFLDQHLAARPAIIAEKN